MTKLRPATAADIQAMVALSEQKRLEYETYQPGFWRKAADSAVRQTEFFHNLLTRESVIALVAEREGQLAGFVIALLQPAPPVYDPGGLTCLVDDFCIARAEDWSTLGPRLLAAVETEARARSAVQTVVVCAHLDQAKRAMLQVADFSIRLGMACSTIAVKEMY